MQNFEVAKRAQAQTQNVVVSHTPLIGQHESGATTVHRVLCATWGTAAFLSGGEDPPMIRQTHLTPEQAQELIDDGAIDERDPPGTPPYTIVKREVKPKA